jgi:hypothetical protein
VAVDGLQLHLVTVGLEVFDRLAHGQEKILGSIPRPPKKVAVPSTDGGRETSFGPEQINRSRLPEVTRVDRYAGLLIRRKLGVDLS